MLLFKIGMHIVEFDASQTKSLHGFDKLLHAYPAPPLTLLTCKPGCTRDQIESQAAAIAECSYGPMLAHAKVGRVTSASPHCCDGNLPKAAEPSEAFGAESAQPEGQQPVTSALPQGSSGDRRVLPPTSPFSGLPASAAQKASRPPLVLSARDLMREAEQVSVQGVVS